MLKSTIAKVLSLCLILITLLIIKINYIPSITNVKEKTIKLMNDIGYKYDDNNNNNNNIIKNKEKESDIDTKKIDLPKECDKECSFNKCLVNDKATVSENAYKDCLKTLCNCDYEPVVANTKTTNDDDEASEYIDINQSFIYSVISYLVKSLVFIAFIRLFVLILQNYNNVKNFDLLDFCLKIREVFPNNIDSINGNSSKNYSNKSNNYYEIDDYTRYDNLIEESH